MTGSVGAADVSVRSFSVVYMLAIDVKVDLRFQTYLSRGFCVATFGSHELAFAFQLGRKHSHLGRQGPNPRFLDLLRSNEVLVKHRGSASVIFDADLSNYGDDGIQGIVGVSQQLRLLQI